MPEKIDVIIVGAGAAGITAAIKLAKAGLSVALLEARSRLGGRMLTLHDKDTGAAVELGAEFIHGKPPEILDILKEHRITKKVVSGDFLRIEKRELQSTDFFSAVHRLMEKMNDRGPDEPFAKFLERCCPHKNQEKIKKWARG